MTDYEQGGAEFLVAQLDFRGRISDALDAVALAHLANLNSKYVGDAPLEGFNAAKFRVLMLRDHGDWGATLFHDAYQRMLIAAIAGLDHVQTFANAFRQPTAGMGLGSITRGAVEAFAKLWWFLDYTSADDLAHRSLTAFAKEFVYMDPEGLLHSANRDAEATVSTVQEGALEDIERLTGQKRPLPMSYTALSSTLLDRVTGGDGRSRYSEFSSVAHAGDIGLGQFVAFSDEGRRIHFALSERSGMAFAYGIYNVMTFALKRFYSFAGFGPEAGSALVETDQQSLAILDAEYFRVYGSYPAGHPNA